MTTKRKAIINARRKTQIAKRKVKNARHQLIYAQLESRIAELQAQIALLKEEGIFLKGTGNRDEEKPLSPIPYLLSPEEGNRDEEGNREKGIGNRDEKKTYPLSPIPYPLFPIPLRKFPFRKFPYPLKKKIPRFLSLSCPFLNAWKFFALKRDKRISPFDWLNWANPICRQLDRGILSLIEEYSLFRKSVF